MAAKKTTDSRSDPGLPGLRAIPQRWLVVMATLFLVPWILIAAIWLKPAGSTVIDTGTPDPFITTRTGSWGQLALMPIVISPPMELVFTDWGFMRRPTWFFPGADADMVSQALQSAGVSASDAARLGAQARFEPRIRGVILSPETAWVRSLTPETRARIYRVLAGSELNVDQSQAFRFRGTRLEEWLSPDLVSPRIRQIIQPLVYRHGSHMFFSDVSLVQAEINSDDELRRLGKALLQQPTLMAYITITREDDINMLVEYWGRAGRRTEIRPLLESLARSGPNESMDITHLLPPFAQEHLYRYPQLSPAELQKHTVANCLWTALNFFRPEPDDRFMDDATAIRTLREDYYIVESEFQLGDIVAFLDETGNLFHAAVHIADDLVFSKNGTSVLAPWVLMSLDDVKDYYRWHSEDIRLVYHREIGF
ncbi:MAG TPA: hypothetical protein VLL97_14305 [Acidobacteriota bacterium]|nr:hypothetical protein [Acidobacteriota bacterium]